MYKLTLITLVSLVLSAELTGQTPLLKDFQNPPNSARPRVWWHWMNGNITQNGIQKDLEWMQRVGIGGFQNFDANLFTPQVVEKKLVFMTLEWKEAFLFATQQADQKGLEMAIAGSPGWSVTGGPWVPAQDGMKKYVWTETRITGGQAFSGKIPQPAATTGNFQHVPLPATTMLGESHGSLPTYYQDAFVFAYKLPDLEKTMAELKPSISSSGGTFSVADLTDGDLAKTTYLPPTGVDEYMWIQYEFSTPQTFRAMSIVGASHAAMEDFNGGPENRTLQVSDDGIDYTNVVKLTGSIVPQNTYSFSPTTGKYWRIVFKTLPPEFNVFAAMAGLPQPEAKPVGVNVAEFVLHTTDRIDQFEDKAGFKPWKEDLPSYKPFNPTAIQPEAVIDLTSSMGADGTLNWTAPDGKWMVVRFGYSLTGRQNHPASPEATGLEVDKLDKEAVRKYINTYLDMYKDATGGLMGAKGLQYMILDSYEAGHMTWTKSFPQEFARRRGYDIKPWLPVLTGRIIKNTESSEQFLWDFRKTIGELIVEGHYEVIGDELHKRGMKRYTESHEDRRIYLADGMDVKRKADVPMAAMWTPGSLAGGGDEEVRSEADIREAASVAHIYGQNIVAAESMTAIQNSFTFTPEKLKRTADLEMASGLNRFVIHTSVHQPLDDKMPGFSLGPFGQWFTRQETWGEQARAWIDYLSRSCHLLQQGQYVADVLYFYGENTNITWRFKDKLPEVPAGYSYDFVNASALLNAIQAKNKELVAPSGMTYKLLVLDESARQMTLPVLKKVRELVRAGVHVTGVKPEKSPSLSDNQEEFKAVVNEIWSSPNASTQPIESVLKSMNVVEDVTISNAKSRIMWVHRHTPNQDIYWLDNRSAAASSATVSFRISGKKPELWNPQTGKTELVSYRIEGDRTIIPMAFDPWGASFIVFRDKADKKSVTLPQTTATELAQINGPWQVRFQEKRGAPASVTLNKLASLSEHTDPGIRYFSGTAAYSQTFKINAVKKGTQVWLDLGDVKNMAEVLVNGKNLGIVWKAPFKVDITEAVKPGDNSLEVRVTNTWVNRLIGDAQPDVKQKITFTTMPFYQANSPLLPSGLLGPVRIVTSDE